MDERDIEERMKTLSNERPINIGLPTVNHNSQIQLIKDHQIQAKSLSLSPSSTSPSSSSSSPSASNSPETSLITIMPIEKEAPDSRAWYHGRLSRDESESRLTRSNKRPAFLLRESDKRPGSFVLSYLALDNSFNHYK